MKGLQCSGKIRPAPFFLPRRILPFCQLRQPLQRGSNGSPQYFWRESRRERINRFNQRHVTKFFRRQNVIRMGNLRLLAIPADFTRNKSRLTFRQAALQMIDKSMEKHQGQSSRLIGNLNPVGQLLVERRWRFMPADLYLNGNDAILRQIDDARAKPPVHNARGQVKQQINNARGCRDVTAQEFPQNLVQLLANAFDAGSACKQGIENRRTHRTILLVKVLQRKCRKRASRRNGIIPSKRNRASQYVEQILIAKAFDFCGICSNQAANDIPS